MDLITNIKQHKSVVLFEGTGYVIIKRNNLNNVCFCQTFLLLIGDFNTHFTASVKSKPHFVTSDSRELRIEYKNCKALYLF